MKFTIALSLLLMILTLPLMAENDQDALRAAEDLQTIMQITLESVRSMGYVLQSNSETTVLSDGPDYDAQRVTEELAAILQVTPDYPIETTVSSTLTPSGASYAFTGCEHTDDHDTCQAHCTLQAVLQL